MTFYEPTPQAGIVVPLSPEFGEYKKHRVLADMQRGYPALQHGNYEAHPRTTILAAERYLAAARAEMDTMRALGVSMLAVRFDDVHVDAEGQVRLTVVTPEISADRGATLRRLLHTEGSVSDGVVQLRDDQLQGSVARNAWGYGRYLLRRLGTVRRPGPTGPIFYDSGPENYMYYRENGPETARAAMHDMDPRLRNMPANTGVSRISWARTAVDTLTGWHNLAVVAGPDLMDEPLRLSASEAPDGQETALTFTDLRNGLVRAVAAAIPELDADADLAIELYSEHYQQRRLIESDMADQISSLVARPGPR